MTTSSRFAVAVHMLSLLARENGSLTYADIVAELAARLEAERDS